MAEEDYEVDESGKKKVHTHRLTVEDIFQEKQANRKQTKKQPSGQTTSCLAKTQCPDCRINVTVKGLERHRREKHSKDFDGFKCSICKFTTKRKASLLDHERRLHLEPVALGRRKKSDKPIRKRSPFRKDVYEHRHGKSMDMLKMNSQLKDTLSSKTEAFNRLEQDKIKSVQCVELLENAKKQNENEMRKLKARLTIIESKLKPAEIPSLENISDLLNYFNLTEKSSKEDITNTINLRLMELSDESLVSSEIFTTTVLSKEDKEEIIMSYNAACDVLLKWKKKQINE